MSLRRGTLDLFGRLAKADAAARAALLSTQANCDSVTLAVVADVAQTYIGLLAADQRLALLRLTLISRAEALGVARRQAESGYSSRLELREAESEYAATAQLVPAAELQVVRLENVLSTLSGAPPGSVARGAGGLDALHMPTVRPGLPAALLRRRPDVVAAENALVATDRSLDSERAAMLPDLSLTASGRGDLMPIRCPPRSAPSASPEASSLRCSTPGVGALVQMRQPRAAMPPRSPTAPRSSRLCGRRRTG